MMKTYQLIGDNAFRQGFYLQPVDGGTDGRVLDFELPGRETAVWKIAQHFSRYDLVKTSAFSVQPDGARVYENEGKRIALTGADGTDTITLDVVGSAEYLHARRPGEAWPHLLIEQDMTSDYIDRYTSLPFTMSIKAEYLRDCTGAEYDPVLHCYQVSLFFVVQNRNPVSPGFGDFVWFGIPYFDSRTNIREMYIAEDCGKDDASGKLIYCLGGQEWYAAHYDRPPEVGQWSTVHMDLLSSVREMVDAAHRKGYLKNTLLSDLQFSSMNLGAEVTGSFDGAISIKNLSLAGMASEK